MTSSIGGNMPHLFQEVLRTYFESDRVDEEAKKAYSQLTAQWNSSKGSPSAPHEWSQIASNAFCIGSHVLQEGSKEKQIASTLHATMQLFSMFLAPKKPEENPHSVPTYLRYGAIAASTLATSWASMRYEDTVLPKILRVYWKVRPLLSSWAQQSSNESVLNFLDSHLPECTSTQKIANIMTNEPLPKVSLNGNKDDLKHVLHLALDLLFYAPAENKEEDAAKALVTNAIAKKLVSSAEKELIEKGMKNYSVAIIPLLIKAIFLSLISDKELAIPSFMREDQDAIQAIREKVNNLSPTDRALFTLCAQTSELPEAIAGALSPEVHSLRNQLSELLQKAEKNGSRFMSTLHLLLLNEKSPLKSSMRASSAEEIKV